MDDRRKNIRYKKAYRVSYKGYQTDNMMGVTRDISVNSMFIETYNPLASGENISASLDAENLGKIITLSGNVVRMSNDGMAVKFTPDDSTQLRLLLS